MTDFVTIMDFLEKRFTQVDNRISSHKRENIENVNLNINRIENKIDNITSSIEKLSNRVEDKHSRISSRFIKVYIAIGLSFCASVGTAYELIKFVINR